MEQDVTITGKMKREHFVAEMNRNAKLVRVENGLTQEEMARGYLTHEHLRIKNDQL